MTTLTSLSNEVIDVILQQENVSIQDVVNFGLTCTRFLAVIDDNNLLWQKKFYQRWPYLKKIYDKRIQNKENINFKDNVKASIQCRNKLRSYLSLMSELFFRKNEPIDVDILHSYVPFFSSEGTHTMNYYFLMDELLYLIAMYPLLPNCNLTHKFYSEKLFPFVHQYHLKDLWQKFMNYPQEQQFLEQAAIIVAQWYQPQKRIFYFDVEASLDNIAQQVLEGLKNVHCDHPIFSISAEQFSFWKYNNINNKQWNRKDERQILDVLRTVFFDELGFHGVSDVNIIYPKAEYILIDCVLETKVGNAISLAIIFQSIARRLGVRCDIVYLPTHIFLSWKPNRDTGSLGDEFFYIDILHGGYMRSKNDCPITRGRRCPIETYNLHTELTPAEMALRIINFLQTVKPQHHQDRALQMRSLMELRYIIEPHNIDVIENLGRHYLRYNINPSGLITTLQKLLNNYNDETSVEANRIAEILRRFELHKQDEMIEFNPCETPKIRSNQMKYAVGMIVDFYNRHVKNDSGVIIWWDEKYNADVKIEYGFRILFGYPELSELPYSSSSDSEKQPFYIVLNENGRTYYVAQDALVKTYPPRWIKHNEIGRYFCRFAKSHYVPNDALTKYFPHDIDFLNTL